MLHEEWINLCYQFLPCGSNCSNTTDNCFRVRCEFISLYIADIHVRKHRYSTGTVHVHVPYLQLRPILSFWPLVSRSRSRLDDTTKKSQRTVVEGSEFPSLIAYRSSAGFSISVLLYENWCSYSYSYTQRQRRHKGRFRNTAVIDSIDSIHSLINQTSHSLQGCWYVYVHWNIICHGTLQLQLVLLHPHPHPWTRTLRNRWRSCTDWIEQTIFDTRQTDCDALSLHSIPMKDWSCKNWFQYLYQYLYVYNSLSFLLYCHPYVYVYVYV